MKKSYSADTLLIQLTKTFLRTNESSLYSGQFGTADNFLDPAGVRYLEVLLYNLAH